MSNDASFCSREVKRADKLSFFCSTPGLRVSFSKNLSRLSNPADSKFFNR